MDLQQPDYSFQALCELIQQFAPCMNDYLYAYDLSTDNFYITERAVERFLIPTNRFQQVVDTLKTFVYPEDFRFYRQICRKCLIIKRIPIIWNTAGLAGMALPSGLTAGADS